MLGAIGAVLSRFRGIFDRWAGEVRREVRCRGYGVDITLGGKPGFLKLQPMMIVLGLSENGFSWLAWLDEIAAIVLVVRVT